MSRQATTTDDELAAMAKAIGHPARVQILRMLVARDTCATSEVVDGLPLAQSTVSEHLRILREAGLVQGEIDGPRTRYCVDPRRSSGRGVLDARCGRRRAWPVDRAGSPATTSADRSRQMHGVAGEWRSASDQVGPVCFPKAGAINQDRRERRSDG
jgi:DNA-binding transcriptional ArsR family regulator